MSYLNTRRSNEEFSRQLFRESNNKQFDIVTDITSHENYKNCNNATIPNQGVVSRPETTDNLLNLGELADTESFIRNQHVSNPQDSTNTDYLNVKRSNNEMCNLNENFTNENSNFSGMPKREQRVEHFNFSPYLPANPQNVVIQNDRHAPLIRLGEPTKMNNNYRTVREARTAANRQHEQNQNSFHNSFNFNKSALVPNKN
jgi:hypothetical protein